MSCCNNIYPECDKERWEVSNSIQLADADNYYTKKEVDDLLDDIAVSGDGITADEAQDLIDEALLDYYTKDEVDAGFNTINSELNKKVGKNSINGVGNIKVESGGGLNSVYIYDRAPIRGTFTNNFDENGYVNGLEVPYAGNDSIAIGKFNNFNDSYISGDTVLAESYFQIGDGENLENRHNIFTIYDNGYIKTTGTDGNDVVLQDWMKEKSDTLVKVNDEVENWIPNMYPHLSNGYINIPHLLGGYVFANCTGIKIDASNEGTEYKSVVLSPISFSGTGKDALGYGWEFEYSATSNVTLSGFTVDGYIPTGGLKTINGQTLEGSGDIQIGTGGTIDLSNYYTKSETNGLLDDKLDASAYTPTDLSGYWTSGETQDAINAATSGIPSPQTIEGFRSDLNALSGDVHTNYYTKSQVDALIATLQNKIDALEAQLEECCSGGGGEDMDGKKYLLHLTDETEHSMECNSSSTLSREDILFASGETLKASAITDVTIGDCVTEIAPMAMQFFSAMTSVNIPSSVTTIGYNAFDACSTLTSLTVPTGVTTIPAYLCSNDYNLATTNIPDGVTSIGTNAYYDCLSLLDITIPSSVTTIGQSAFRVNNWTASDPENYAKMQNLLANRVVRCLATTPPSVDSITFDVDSAGVSVTYPIYVPAESVEAYKAASGWSTYADRIQALP